MGIFSPSSPASSGSSSSQSQQRRRPGGPLGRVFSRKNSSKKKQPQHEFRSQSSSAAGAAESAATSSPNLTVQSKSSEQFTADQLKKLRSAFDYFDIDNDGRISSGELRKVLNFLGNGVSEAEAQLMIAEVDENCSGAVEFNEFIKMMSEYQRANSQKKIDPVQTTPEDAEILEAFQAFDHNGDNYIDFTELKKTMQFLGELVSDSDVSCMIRQADTNLDGRIDLQEFKWLMTAMKRRAGTKMKASAI